MFVRVGTRPTLRGCGGNKSARGGVKGGGERQKWVGEQRVGAGETEKRGERVVEATSKEQEVREGKGLQNTSKTFSQRTTTTTLPPSPCFQLLLPLLSSSLSRGSRVCNMWWVERGPGGGCVLCRVGWGGGCVKGMSLTGKI